MIIKNLTRNGTSGSSTLIKYLFKYILKPEKRKSAINPHSVTKADIPFVYTHNIRSKTIAGFIDEFNNNTKRRLYQQKNQTVCHHTILSWARADAKQLTDTKLKAIIKKFIGLRGKDLLYVFSKHSDKEHIHIHAAVSGVRLNGLSSRISKADFAALKVQLDAYQHEMFPELISLPNHGAKRAKIRDLTPETKSILNPRESKKSEIIQLLKGHEGAHSAEKIIASLKKRGYEPYYRKYILTGVQHTKSGLKFRFSTLGVSIEKDPLESLRNLRYGKDKNITRER